MYMGIVRGEVNIDAVAYCCYPAHMVGQPPQPEIEVWARLIRVSQTLAGEIETDLKAADCVPLSWYDALLELDRAGDPGLRPFQLQDRMLLAQYNLSRLLDRLAKAGYVARSRSLEDGRGQVLRITPEGRAARRRTWPVYRDAIQRRFAGRLDDESIGRLGDILARLRD